MRYSGIGIIILLTGPLVLAQQPGTIGGDYLEARSNHVFGCYCEWSGEAITTGREAILAWSIKSGEYRRVNLAGVRVAAVIVSQASLSAGVPPRSSVLIFDTAVTKDQQQAARALLEDQYGDLLGRIVKIHLLPVEFLGDGGEVRLSAGDDVHVSMRKARLPDDAMKGATLWYEPFIQLTESTLATTLNSRYVGSDFDRIWDDTDLGVKGYYGRFSVDAP